jgi:DNA polymerase-3 subunit gamma/tau
MLKRINKAENIKIDNELLTLIAKSSDNSFRDAAKTLQELVIQKKLNFKDAQTYLGIRGKDNFLSILQNKDVHQALAWVEEFYQTGNDIKGLIIQVMEDLRLLILEKNKTKKNNRNQLDLSLKQISLLMKLLNEAYSNLKNSPLEIIPLEVAIIEFYNRQN